MINRRKNTIMKMKTPQLLTVALTCALAVAATGAHAQTASPLQTSRDTRIGRIELDQGFPSKAAVTKLYDELDFQRACQAYIWGLPIVGFAEWQASVAKSLGAGDLDYVLYLSVEDKLGVLTPNASTPYILAFPDLSKTGPLVVEVPVGPSGGGVLDFWQRPTTDTGFAGPDKGEGAKYLILPPGSPDIKADGYRVFRSPTFNIFVGSSRAPSRPCRSGCVDQDTAPLPVCPAGQSSGHPVPETRGSQVEPSPAARTRVLGTSGRHPQS